MHIITREVFNNKIIKVRTQVKLLLIVSIIPILIIFGELFSRFVIGLGTPPIYTTHPQIEYLLKPNQDVFRFGNRIQINKYGMRSQDFSQEKKGNEYRVMVFGDSVINGGNLTDQNDLATTITQNRLNETLAQKVIVGNISAGSWGPGNWLAYEQEYGFFDTDIVVLVISSSDYTDNPTFTPLNTNTHPTHYPISALAEGLERYLPRYLPSLHKKKITTSEKDDFFNQKKNEIKVGTSQLRRFLTDAKSKTKNLFVLQHWEKSEIERGKPNPGNLTIKEICDSLGVSTIQLKDSFKLALARGKNPYRDNIHPNIYGQKLIADEIVSNILEFHFLVE